LFVFPSHLLPHLSLIPPPGLRGCSNICGKYSFNQGCGPFCFSFLPLSLSLSIYTHTGTHIHTHTHTHTYKLTHLCVIYINAFHISKKQGLRKWDTFFIIWDCNCYRSDMCLLFSVISAL